MKNPYNYYGGYIPVAQDASIFEINTQPLTREQFGEKIDNLMIEIGYRYHIPELDLIEFYGVKKIREFKKSHKSLFASINR